MDIAVGLQPLQQWCLSFMFTPGYGCVGSGVWIAMPGGLDWQIHFAAMGDWRGVVIMVRCSTRILVPDVRYKGLATRALGR